MSNNSQTASHDSFASIPGSPDIPEMEFYEDFPEEEEDEAPPVPEKKPKKKAKEASSNGTNPMIRKALIACLVLLLAGSGVIGGWVFFGSTPANDTGGQALMSAPPAEAPRQPINPLTGAPMVAADQVPVVDQLPVDAQVFDQSPGVEPQVILPDSAQAPVQVEPQPVVVEPTGREVVSFPAEPQPQAREQIEGMLNRVGKLEEMIVRMEASTSQQMARLEAALQQRTAALTAEPVPVASAASAPVPVTTAGVPADVRELEATQKKIKEQTGIIAQLRRERDDLQAKLRESEVRYVALEKVNREQKTLLGELEKKIAWLLDRPVMPGWRVAGMSTQFVMFRSDDGTRMVKMAPGDVFAGIKILKIDVERGIVETNFGTIKSGGK